MQYFEVSILVFFKCQSIPVANSLNKSIAFFQKCKKAIFSNSLFILKEIEKKKQTQIFTLALQVFWLMEAFEQQ